MIHKSAIPQETLSTLGPLIPKHINDDITKQSSFQLSTVKDSQLTDPNLSQSMRGTHT